MPKVTHKLSNVLLDIDERVSAFPGMYYRAAGDRPTYSHSEAGLPITAPIDFLTYFGACSLEKWKRYAGIRDVTLRLRLSGAPCDVVLQGFTYGDAEPITLATMSAESLAKEPRQHSAELSGDIRLIDVAFPATDKAIVGFALKPAGRAVLHEASYITHVEENRLNRVRLALSTTTFCKEDYILPNITLITEEVLGCDEPIAQSFHMFVVDNGRTLDAKALTTDGVTVIPNPNTGGAGGFARGMMAALDADESGEPFTHILLMDDDVVMSPESLKRTYNLLALAQGKYRDAFVNGAMLTIEEPRKKIEDVARVLWSGDYNRVRDKFLHVDDIVDMAESEAIDVEVPNAYGAWWYSCIPMSVVREKGLPLPLFVRCDDVEYGVRAQGTYMTMNGICVWHEGFTGRFKPSVDCYQFARNFMVMNAMDDCASEAAFMQRIQRTMRFYLRTMYYDAVELFLDGIEDYLKGPEFLASVDGEQLMRENGARNEQLAPIEELDPKVRETMVLKPHYLNADYQTSLLAKLWRTLPYDRHLLPDALLRDRPVAVLYSQSGCMTPAATGTRTLVAMDEQATNGYVRHMDKDRYRAIKKRWREVMRDYRQRGADVRAAYKAAQPYLTSRDFWEGYLGL